MPITDAMPELNRTLQFFPVENENPLTLTSAQIEHFNEKGFISPLDVFSEARWRRIAPISINSWKGVGSGMNSYSINGWHTSLPGYPRSHYEDRILDYVQDLLGETLICWGTHYFCKMPVMLSR